MFLYDNNRNIGRTANINTNLIKKTELNILSKIFFLIILKMLKRKEIHFKDIKSLCNLKLI